MNYLKSEAFFSFSLCSYDSKQAIRFLENWKPQLDTGTESASVETLYHLLDGRKYNDFIHFFVCSGNVFELSVKLDDLKKMTALNNSVFFYFLGDGLLNRRLQQCCKDTHKFICHDKNDLQSAFILSVKDIKKRKSPKKRKKHHPSNSQVFPEWELKTVLCKFYKQGNCKNGIYCTFAHGEHELNTEIRKKPSKK